MHIIYVDRLPYLDKASLKAVIADLPEAGAASGTGTDASLNVSLVFSIHLRSVAVKVACPEASRRSGLSDTRAAGSGESEDHNTAEAGSNGHATVENPREASGRLGLERRSLPCAARAKEEQGTSMIYAKNEIGPAYVLAQPEIPPPPVAQVIRVRSPEERNLRQQHFQDM